MINTGRPCILIAKEEELHMAMLYTGGYIPGMDAFLNALWTDLENERLNRSRLQYRIRQHLRAALRLDRITPLSRHGVHLKERIAELWLGDHNRLPIDTNLNHQRTQKQQACDELTLEVWPEYFTQARAVASLPELMRQQDIATTAHSLR